MSAPGIKSGDAVAEESYRRYQEGGAAAVHEYAEELRELGLGVGQGHCAPCEAVQPVCRGDCLVCSTPAEGSGSAEAN